MPQSQNRTIVKKAVVIISLLLLAKISPAQTKYGITAGTGKTSLYKFPVPPEDNDAYKGQTSWWAGLTVNKTLLENNLSLVGSALFSKKGYKYTVQRENGANNTIKDSSFSQDLKYAEINLYLRKKFMLGEESTQSVFVATGPSASLFLNGKEQVQASYFGNVKPAMNNTNNKLVKGSGAGQYNPAFFSCNFAIGVELNDIAIWLHTGIALSDYFQDAGKAEKHKIKTFGINASFSFYTHHKKERTVKERPAKHDITPVAVKDSALTDTDGDGIADVNDKCPTVKGVGRYMGCPVPDTDGDGVNDEEDRCKTVPGTAANHGCPEAIADTLKNNAKDTVRFVVYFEPGKSILRSEAYQTLTQVVNMLKANSKLSAICNGHTDYVGNEDANYSRSLARATVCADYISSFYISKTRVTINAFGNKMPAADLTDPLVQWKNRRVEILVFESK
jgi:outer membrane protein OmpA-like peptidoglycan-associated protein